MNIEKRVKKGMSMVRYGGYMYCVTGVPPPISCPIECYKKYFFK